MEIKDVLEQLRSSYFMYEDSIIEFNKKIRLTPNDPKNKKKIELILKAQKQVEEDYYHHGGTEENLKAPRDKDKHIRKSIKEFRKTNKNVNTTQTTKPSHQINETPKMKTNKIENTKPNDVDYFSNVTYNEDSPFDLVPIPSKGMCYKNGVDKIPIGYLTAEDEDIITSPNLYTDNLIVEYILKQKVKIPNFKPSTLIPGDKDALLLWLRITGYGPEYPVTATDPITKEKFDTVIDLTMIKSKPLNIKADEDGLFDYTMPISKDNIKFKYLTIGDLKGINNDLLHSSSKLKKDKLIYMTKEIESIIENDINTDVNIKNDLFNSIDSLNEWINNIEVEECKISNDITTTLYNHIVDVNGETDRGYIKKYVNKIIARDSLELRRYIKDNEPGLDFNLMVERPASLGGGSVKMFLTLDSTLFLNIL